MSRESSSGERPKSRPSPKVWHYWLYWAGVACAIAAALTAFGVIGSGHYKRHAESSRGGALFQQPPISQNESFGLPEQQLYPYSVIPGGVHSGQELRNAVAHDPLVAQHYADFDVSRAHVVDLDQDEAVYVSYRLYNHIYWTKKRLMLRRGEAVITDGTHQARTRCGNRISQTPVQPVSSSEPPAAAMNTPEHPTLVAENAQKLGTIPVDPQWTFEPPLVPPTSPGLPGSTPPGFVIPPPAYPIVGGGPPSPLVPLPPPPIATPEPSTILLLVLGLFALSGGRILVRSRR